MSVHRNRLSAIALAIVVSIAVAACNPATTTPVPPTSQAGGNPGGAANAVTIQGFAFSPASITVAVGTTVTWTNKDSAAHTVSADDGKTFDSGSIASGASFSFTFKTAGTFSYHCGFHTYMKGAVTVTG